MGDPTEPTLSRLGKGALWELRVHRATYLSGWYVRRGVNLRERVKGSPQTLAEVDILGLAVDPHLQRQALVGECKDRKGGAKEADRVVWLLGLRRVLSSDRVLFAKTTLSDATRQWAGPFDVVLWDEAQVSAIEKAHHVDPQSGFAGSFNPDLPLLSVGTGAGGRATSLKRAVEYITGAFWYESNPARSRRVASYFDTVRTDLEDDTPAARRACAEGILALMWCAIQSAAEFRRTSPPRARVNIHDALASGVASAPALRDIAARADDYYHDAIARLTKEIGRGAPIRMPRLADVIAQPPKWTPDYVSLAEEFGRATLALNATDLMRFADMLLLETLTMERAFPANLLSVTKAEEALRLVQVAGLFAQRVWGIQCPLIDALIATSLPDSPSSIDGAPDTVQLPLAPVVPSS